MSNGKLSSQQGARRRQVVLLALHGIGLVACSPGGSQAQQSARLPDFSVSASGGSQTHADSRKRMWQKFGDEGIGLIVDAFKGQEFFGVEFFPAGSDRPFYASSIQTLRNRSYMLLPLEIPEKVRDREDIQRSLAAPATESDLVQLHHASKHRLPPSLVELYRYCDGERRRDDDQTIPVFFDYLFINIKSAVQEIANLRTVAAFWQDSMDELDLRSDPPGAVQRQVYVEGWFPFASDSGGNYLAVDMAPSR